MARPYEDQIREILKAKKDESGKGYLGNEREANKALRTAAQYLESQLRQNVLAYYSSYSNEPLWNNNKLRLSIMQHNAKKDKSGDAIYNIKRMSRSKYYFRRKTPSNHALVYYIKSRRVDGGFEIGFLDIDEWRFRGNNYSSIDPKYDYAYTPVLLDQGWSWGSGKKDHFHGYEGFHYIRKTIEDFNKVRESNGWEAINIKVSFRVDGKYKRYGDYVMSNYIMD